MTFDRFKAQFFKAGGSLLLVDEDWLRMQHGTERTPAAVARLSKLILSPADFDRLVQVVTDRALAQAAAAAAAARPQPRGNHGKGKGKGDDDALQLWA